MMSLILPITVLLGLLLVPAIDMKRKRCHKRPTLVECPEPLPRTTCDHWNMTVTTGERYAGDTRLLSCSAGYSIIGNVSITCLASGAWSPISAICAPNDISEAYLRSFRDSTYIFVHTRKNYDEAKETCISMCGQLLEINDKEEDTFIDSTIPEVVPAVDITDNYFPWIGLEIKVGGTHEWQSGNTTNSNNFANWFKSEPNYLILGSCSYLTNLGHGYQWFDGPKSICTTEKRQFICESRFA